MDALLQAVTFDEKLAYQNVVSRRATFHYSTLGAQLAAFVSDVVRRGGTPKGPYVYSLNNVPLDEITDIEFFLPIREDTFTAEEGTRFHSYFEVGPLVKGIVTGDFEHRTEQVYAQLLAALDGNGLEINAPFFHVLPEDGSKYASVYVGYVDPREAVD